MENGTLPAGQDIKVPRDAVGQHLAQGWSLREDQSDAASDPSDGVTPSPVEPVGGEGWAVREDQGRAASDPPDGVPPPRVDPGGGDETSDPPAEVEQNQDDA